MPSAALSKLDRLMPCEYCLDTGFTLSQTRDRRIAVACVCRGNLFQRETAGGSRRRSLDVPARYSDVSANDRTIANMRPHARRRLLAFVGDIHRRITAGKGVWLHGPASIDKSTAAALAAKSAADAGHLVTFETTLNLLAELKDPRLFDDPRKPTPAYKITGTDLLVLRDLDLARQDDWALPRMAAELRRRAERHIRSMVLTTSGEIQELAEVWGWRTLLALKSICGAPINVDPDYIAPPPDPVAIRLARRKRAASRSRSG